MKRMDTSEVAFGELSPKKTAIEGDPRDAEFVLDESGGVETGMWTCSPGSFKSEWKDIAETFHVIEGAGTLTDGEGRVHDLGPGVVISIPPGSTGTWEITSTLVKSYMVSSRA